MSNKAAKLPKYQEIRSWLLEMLSTKGFEKGDKFYSETWVAKELSSAPMTVRKAFALLEDESYIRREQGVGSFVIKVPEKPTRYKVIEHCNIGIYIDRIEEHGNMVFGPLLTEVYRGIGQRGYMANTSMGNAELLIESKVDGLIIFGGMPEKGQQLIKTLGIPAVAYGKWGIDSFPCVYQALDTLGRKVFRKFSRKGRSRTAVLYFGNENSHAFIKASVEAAVRLEMTETPGLRVDFYSATDDNVVETVTSLCTAQERPDSILLLSWQSVTAVVQTLERLSLRMPEDIGLICYGGDYITLNTNPPISLLHCNYVHGVKILTDMLFNMIENKHYKGENMPNEATLDGMWTV